MNFTELHQQEKPLLICNVWDAASTKIAEKLNFQAIGTSSAAIAEMLGYADGEEMNFSELILIVKRILDVTNLPLSVDLESGYSRDSKEIANHITMLKDLGVVGINLEDSLVDENGRQLIPAEPFAKSISEINQHLGANGQDIFLNVRIDPYLTGHSDPLKETQARAKLYTQAGADGLFIPGMTAEHEIQAITSGLDLPVNVMCMPNLPSFGRLTKLGVKRISMGNFPFQKMMADHQVTLSKILTQQSFKSLF